MTGGSENTLLGGGGLKTPPTREDVVQRYFEATLSTPRPYHKTRHVRRAGIRHEDLPRDAAFGLAQYRPKGMWHRFTLPIENNETFGASNVSRRSRGRLNSLSCHEHEKSSSGLIIIHGPTNDSETPPCITIGCSEDVGVWRDLVA